VAIEEHGTRRGERRSEVLKEAVPYCWGFGAGVFYMAVASLVTGGKEAVWAAAMVLNVAAFLVPWWRRHVARRVDQAGA